MVTSGSVQAFLRRAGWVALILPVALLGWFFRCASAMPSMPLYEPTPTTINQNPPPRIHEAPWSVIKGMRAQVVRGRPDSLNGRFRLAGTFSSFSGSESRVKAIIDDLQANEQYMLSEGDEVASGVSIGRIFPDRVILRSGDETEELWLNFSGGVSTDPSAEMSSDASAEDSPGLSFGKRTGKDRWVLKREDMMAYYNEVMAEPDRLVKVFDSLKPVYNDGRKITGYILDIEGEREMFEAFGLREGDIVRRVNSMKMVSQARAEYMIKEFVNNKVNAFVLDIERNGAPTRFTYLVR